MASYKSGFDPPTRPGDLPRGRRLGAYMQAGASGSPAKDRREADTAHIISGQIESRRDVLPSTRPPQIGLPSPSTRQRSERTERPERPKGITGSSFGFGRSESRAPAEKVQPELKGKSSRNVLRRKPSSIAQVSGNSRSGFERAGSSSPTKWSQTSAEQRPSIDSSIRSAEAYNEIFTRSRARAPPVKDSPPIIPELDRYRSRPEAFGSYSRVHADLPPKLYTHDLPPPTPLLSGTPGYSGGSRYSGSGYSASPSTRFSESPGPGSYSRDTTPTSMSSQSPGIIAPLKITTPRLRQGSPAFSRPPVTSVTRRRAVSISTEDEAVPVDQHGLPSLRESLTSSSSNSTVKGDGKSKEKKKKKRLSPMPPSPPPRKSSQKFNKPRSEEQDSPSKSSQVPQKLVMTSTESSPATAHTIQSPSAPVKKSGPPTRPSREGAPDLQTQLGDSMTVIQSNLAGINFSPDRRKSALPRSAVTSPPLVARSQQSSRLPSRNPSPVPVQPSPREATPAPSGLGIIPTLRPGQNMPSRSTVSRTPSPSLANSKPRFGLFGRRTKTAPDLPTVETKEKVLRKGPVAGTGHEGYGRYSHRGRSSSTGGLGRSRDRSTSGASSPQESIASNRAHDPFLLERMSPVIIAGGGEIIENRNTSSELSRTESNTSLLLGRPSMDSKGSSNTSREAARTTLWPSALPKEPTKRASTSEMPKGRRPSDTSDDGIGKSSLAFRRSVQRMNTSDSALNLPRPLYVSRGVSPSITSLDASIMSDESLFEVKSEVEKTTRAQLTKPKKLEKRPKSPRKWNFFHRSQPTPNPEPQPALQVTVAKTAPKSTAVPHYAMLDSSDEQVDLEPIDLEDILRDADVVSLSNEELDMLQFGEVQEIQQRKEARNSRLAGTLNEQTPIFSSPEPFQVTPELPQTDLHLVQETAPVRPSRLAQVGRIPKVISARPETTSPKSFSRPFARLSTAQPLPRPQVVDKESVGLGPSPPKPSTPEPFQPEPFQSIHPEMEDLSRHRSTETQSEKSGASHHDFLAFSPRKNSEATTSSSGCLSLAEITAVVPEADAALEEDEVWDEYDDLIENDDTVKVPVSATSSHGIPFQYESYESRRIRKSKAQSKESLTLASAPKIMELPTRRSALTSSSVYSGDMSARLRDALNTIPTPTTPMSFTDFFSGYGDRNNSICDESAQKPRRSSNSSSRKSASSSSHSQSNSGLRTISEQENSSPISQVNLRVGSMTVSKWLTFGHVLFSPAREDIMQLEGSTKRHSILIIDGLGNDDWSFFAAEAYPNSTFYNLSPTRALSNPQRSSASASFPLSPPNHRQIQYLSTSHKFPFPSSTFDVVVFRFPTAMSEASYRNIIAESKRVLKPGGYLEMAILDLDMMNMGNRARRAVRSLKVRMQIADPDISLASASDTVLRIVSKRGFSDIKSCNVGVPVASTVPATSKDTSNIEGASDKGKDREHGQTEELSLAEMMKDESRSGDESITKMVAKVGRWWFTRCYETGVIPEGDLAKSIFNDSALLGESEKWNASFKLVVAYAQKPVVGRRRTTSL